MKPSPLQLKHYHFTRLSVEARKGVDMDALAQGDSVYPEIDEKVDFRIEIELGERVGHDDDFAVRLALSGEPQEDSNFPYRFSAEIEGMFTISGDDDNDTRKKIVVVNGASMLYGAIRDQLMSITARHMYGAMMLPSADFRGLAEEKPNPDSPEQLQTITSKVRRVAKRSS